MPQTSKQAVYALGNFDGVHKGHIALIEQAKVLATTLGVKLAVLTFEPHPRMFFSPESAMGRLTSPAQKVDLLDAAGVHEICVMNFDTKFSALSPEQFIDDVLLGQLGAAGVVAGEDFRFGCKRAGDMHLLHEKLKTHDIPVLALGSVKNESGHRYSATAARLLLRDGAVGEVQEILGRLWSLRGTVVAGAARGRLIGFPTANIALGDYVVPRLGVYAVTAQKVGSTERFWGVANIGQRPTFNDHVEPRLEMHLFDFTRDIYGEEWEVTLRAFIRDEKRFSGIDELKTQIAADAEVARQRLCA